MSLTGSYTEEESANIHKYTSFIKDDKSRRGLFLGGWGRGGGGGYLADKSNDRVGHLNTILARGWEFERSNFKSLNARGLPLGEGGC